MWSPSYWSLLTWLSDSNSATFKTVVHGIIGGVPVPFPTANGDVNPPVPIQQNQKITYTNAIFVEPAYPKVLIQTQSVCSISQYLILLMFFFFTNEEKDLPQESVFYYLYFKWMKNRLKIISMSWFAHSLLRYIIPTVISYLVKKILLKCIYFFL